MTKTLSAALAVLFVDRGVRLVQTADGLTKQANDRLRDTAGVIAALLAATDFSNSVDVDDTLQACRNLLSTTYNQVRSESVESLAQLPAIERDFVVESINAAANQTLMRAPRLTVSEPDIDGSSVSAWWKGQEADTQAKLVHAVRAAILERLKAQDIADSITAATGPLATAMRHAETLTHTAVQRVAMDTRNAVFAANRVVVEGLQVVATLDSHTCAQCLAYDGSTYSLEGEPTGNTVLPFNGGPAYHFGCRCGTVPTMKGDEAPEPLTAQDWLGGKTEAEQDDILGKGRAALYRKGSLTLRDLVSGTGQQLSLDDLRKKHN